MFYHLSGAAKNAINTLAGSRAVTAIDKVLLRKLDGYNVRAVGDTIEGFSAHDSRTIVDFIAACPGSADIKYKDDVISNFVRGNASIPAKEVKKLLPVWHRYKFLFGVYKEAKSTIPDGTVKEAKNDIEQAVHDLVQRQLKKETEEAVIEEPVEELPAAKLKIMLPRTDETGEIIEGYYEETFQMPVNFRNTAKVSVDPAVAVPALKRTATMTKTVTKPLNSLV